MGTGRRGYRVWRAFAALGLMAAVLSGCVVYDRDGGGWRYHHYEHWR